MDGYRYFGLADVAEAVESVVEDAFRASESELDELEAEADRRYDALVPSDSSLVQAF